MAEPRWIDPDLNGGEPSPNPTPNPEPETPSEPDEPSVSDNTVSKVVYCGETLIDLTSDTVSADTLAEGVTAHNAKGEVIVGTMSSSGGGGSSSGGEEVNVLDRLIVETINYDGYNVLYVGVKDYNCVGATVKLIVEGTLMTSGGFSPDVESGKFEVEVSFGEAYVHYTSRSVAFGIANVRKFTDEGWNTDAFGFPSYSVGENSSVPLPASWRCSHEEYDMIIDGMYHAYSGVVLYDDEYLCCIDVTDFGIISASITTQ